METEVAEWNVNRSETMEDSTGRSRTEEDGKWVAPSHMEELSREDANSLENNELIVHLIHRKWTAKLNCPTHVFWGTEGKTCRHSLGNVMEEGKHNSRRGREENSR